MALSDILTISEQGGHHQKVGISEERINAIKPILRQYIAYWREYPDMFVDFLQTGASTTKVPDDGLHFFYYQRVRQEGPFTW